MLISITAKFRTAGERAAFARALMNSPADRQALVDLLEEKRQVIVDFLAFLTDEDLAAWARLVARFDPLMPAAQPADPEG